MDNDKYLLQMLQDIAQMNATLTGIQNDIKDIQKIVKKVDIIEEDVKHIHSELDEIKQVTSKVLPMEERIKTLEDEHKITSGALATVITALVVEVVSRFL